MFIKQKHWDACIQKVRVEVGTLVGLDSDSEAFLTLRELPTMQMLRLKDVADQGEEQTLGLLHELLPIIIVDHNFYEDEAAKHKMTNQDVADLIFESLDLTVKVVNEYTQASFFTQAQRKGAKLPHSVQKSLTEGTPENSTESTDDGSPT